MTKEEREKRIEHHVAKVIHHDGPLCLPRGMSEEVAMEILRRKSLYDEREVSVIETIPVFIWDGAIALRKALEELFGFSLQTETEYQTMFGKVKEPPAQISIPISATEKAIVPWGSFELPGIKGSIQTGISVEDGRYIFQLSALVRHKDEEKIRTIADRTRHYAMTESIYRGRAIALKFTNEKGVQEKLPVPKFLSPKPLQVIFSDHLERSIATNILTPICYTQSLRDQNIPLKRGVLLAGPYGTGKTLTANLVALTAIKNGWTFIYVTKTQDLPQILAFSRLYQPAVVFAEDIDRLATAERTEEVNKLLNTLDGIDSKGDEILTILTSNNAENINAAMRRPGRIDLVLSVDPPDSKAAIRLMRHYAGPNLPETEDLQEAGKLLATQIPAVIREVVERAKLETIRRTEGTSIALSAQDIENSAKDLLTEIKLFTPKAPPDHLFVQFGDRLGSKIAEAILETSNGSESDK